MPGDMCLVDCPCGFDSYANPGTTTWTDSPLRVIAYDPDNPDVITIETEGLPADAGRFSF